MARTSIKATYSLDSETVELLERMARRWKVSKSEALRRALHAASGAAAPATTAEVERKLAALDRLQRSMRLTKEQADAWVAEIRAVRDAY